MFGLTRSEMSRRVFADPNTYTRPETLFAPDTDTRSRTGDRMSVGSTVTDQIYQHDMIVSGYDGHIPTMQEKFGETSKDLFIKALSDFEDDRTFESRTRLDFQWQRKLEQGAIVKENLPKDSLVRAVAKQMEVEGIGCISSRCTMNASECL